MTNEYQRRRQRLMAAIGPDSIAIVPAATEKVRSNDTHYLFRQDSDFVYLTGFDEPDGILVLTPGHSEGESSLFIRPKDALKEQWDGYRLGADAAVEALGVSRAFPLEDFKSVLPTLLEDREQVHTSLSDGASPSKDVKAGIGRAQRKRGADRLDVVSLASTLHELRLFKSATELEVMQQAVDISVAAHRAVMQTCQPEFTEQRIEAEFLFQCAQRGARHAAYPCIVAGGANACIMHYVENSGTLRDGDLLLIDAGCEYQHYASDITRTFPVNGRFSARQRDLYQIVLAAQEAAINEIRPGVGFDQPHERAARVLAQGLIDLDILSASVDVVLEEKLAHPYTVHRLSHWLGLDVHDVGAHVREDTTRNLQANMVITVEPGLYFLPSQTEVPEQWRGLGVRIEDDVCVTNDGCRVMSKALEKTVDDVEALMNA